MVPNADLVPFGAIFVIPPVPGGTKVPVYNLVPAEGEPAKFGFIVNGKIPVFLETQVAWESDYHESFTIKLAFTAELTCGSIPATRYSFGTPSLTPFKSRPRFLV